MFGEEIYLILLRTQVGCKVRSILADHEREEEVGAEVKLVIADRRTIDFHQSKEVIHYLS